MRLMGGLNWWAPAPLHRLWLRLGMGDLEGGAPDSTGIEVPPTPDLVPVPVEERSP